MKDSGIEWIGEIPDDWKVSRIKYFCKIINGFPFDSNDFGRDFPFKVVRIGDIQNDTVDWENCVSVSNNNIKSCNLCKGDAIIALSGATVGKTAFINDEIEDCYINQRVAIIRSTHIKYILYTLKTIGFAEYVTLSSSGSAQSNLSTGQIGNYYFLVSDKQDLIVNFLDKKCTEIDCLIAHEEAMIYELKAYKQSVITETVTEGLDRSVPMKDSGVEWIGEIPIHWNHEKLKFHIKIRNDNIIDASDLDYIALENIESFSGKFISSENQYDILQSKMANADDVLFGKLRPYLAKVYLLPKNAAVSAEFLVLSAISVNKIYLKWYLLSFGFIDIVNASTYGAKMPRANADFIKNCTLLLPPTDEQQQIAEYLDRKCDEIDQLISLKQEKIEGLRDYKKSLIYEYVTGKKEVCE